MKTLVLVCFLGVVLCAAGIPIADAEDPASATNVPSSADSFVDDFDALLESQEVTDATTHMDALSETAAVAALAAAQAGLASQAAQAQAEAEDQAAAAALAAAPPKTAGDAKAATSAKANAGDADQFVHSDPNDQRLPAMADAVKDAIDSGRKSCRTKAPGSTVRSVRVLFARHQFVSRGDREYELEMESIDVHGFVQVFLANVRWRHADDAHVLRVDGKSVLQRAQIVSIVPRPCDVGDAATLLVTSAQVDNINAQKLPWTAALNSKFRGVSLADVSHSMGFTPASNDPILWITGGSGVALPEAYDARDTRTHEAACVAFQPKDQGRCASCYAFGSTSSLAARLCMSTKRSINFDLSFQEAMECTTGCGTGSVYDVYTKMYTQPLVPAACEPYTSYTNQKSCGVYSCAKPFQVFTQQGSYKHYMGMTAMQENLLVNGPTPVAFDLYDDLFSYGCVRFRVYGCLLHLHVRP